MMKTALVFLLVLMCVGVAFGGAKRVVDYPPGQVGIDTVLLLSHDSANATTVTIPLCTPFGEYKSWDGFIGWFYAPNMALYVDTSVAGKNAVDTVILTITAGWGYRRDTVLVDTLLPPDTAVFEWWNDNDFVRTGSVTLIDADSSSDSAWAGGVYVPTDKPSRRLMYYDNLYIDVYESDSAGTGDSLAGYNQYRVRFIENHPGD